MRREDKVSEADYVEYRSNICTPAFPVKNAGTSVQDRGHPECLLPPAGRTQDLPPLGQHQGRLTAGASLRHPVELRETVEKHPLYQRTVGASHAFHMQHVVMNTHRDGLDATLGGRTGRA